MNRNPPDFGDTDAVTRARYLDAIAAVPAAERLFRALALSAMVRALAWDGARQHTGRLGGDAVRDRFLLQLYGPAVAQRTIAALRGAPLPPGAAPG